MNIASILLWGFVATVALTTLMSISHGAGLTCQRVLGRLAEENVIQCVGSYYGALRKDFVAANFVTHNLNRHYR